MNRIAIFDCDGTLVDSQHSICLAMEACFEEAGLDPPSRERTRAIVGLSLPEAMASLLPDADPGLHQHLTERYKQAFWRLRAEGLCQEPLYDGIFDLLDALEAEGWMLGVATGKSDRGLSLCLEMHGLSGRFHTLQTADRHPSKPHPSMIVQALTDSGSDAGLSVMIGDTSFDMMMAAAAGVAPIGVTWGYHDAGMLRAAGARALLDRPADLLDYLKAPA